ncbi:MAG: CRISPR-associated endonuclease Cas2 [Minisyncoccia bacterium]
MESKKRIRKQKGNVPISSLVLRSLVGAGVVGIAIFAPKMTRLLKEFDRPAKNRTELYRRISQALARLQEAGLVEISGEWGKRRVVLTEKGKEIAEEAEFEEYAIPEPAFWDGKWRVLMFDITERRRATRDRLRHMLQHTGFVRLQDSVWVYPYPCDEFIALVRAHLKSGIGEMRSFVAEALESDKELRKHFKLT